MQDTIPTDARPVLKIFLSSPGDVNEERVLANRVMRRLADRYAPIARISPVIWEHEPLLASSTFQDQIEKPSATDIVVCILWSRLGTRLPAHIQRTDGSRYDSGTEYEFEDAWAALKQTGRPDLLVYRKMAEPLISLSDDREVEERLRQKRALDGFIQKWFHDQDGSLLAAFHAFRDSAEFEDAFEVHLDKLIQRRLADLGITADDAARLPIAPGEQPDWDGSPFRGLETFEFEHAPIFYGRTRAISGVLDALRRQAAAGQAFVLILGRSGGGKSSLARAGVIPLLVEPGVIEGVGLWRRAVFRPGEALRDPFEALARALTTPEALPELLSDGTTRAELAALLRDTPAGAAPLIKGALSQAALTEAMDQAEAALAARPDLAPDAAQSLRTAARAAPPQARLVLLVDQLEEIFTAAAMTDQTRQDLMAAVAALARSGRVFVLATLRSDFYHRCAEVPALAALKEGEGQYDLQPPTAAEIAQIIRLPARRAGLGFEDHPDTGARLDDVLRDIAASEPDSLPLLEFTLDALYQARSPQGLLTWAAYDALGGVAGALGKRAEDTFRALDPQAQAALPEVMRQIVHMGIGRDQQATKRPAPLAAFAADSPARRLVDSFIAARLFVVGDADGGDTVLTLTHEAILGSWPRLRDWLEADREFLRMRSRLGFAVDRWADAGRDAQLLLPAGVPLEEARALRRAAPAELRPAETEFIRQSEARATRGRRLRQAAVAALALLGVAASGAAWYADGQRRQAADNARLAETARASAETSAAEAETARIEADAARQIAETNEAAAIAARTEAETSRAAAQERLNELFVEQGRRALLDRRAEEAVLILGAAQASAPDPVTAALFGQAHDIATIRQYTVQAHAGPVIALATDGRGRMVSASARGEIVLRDTASGAVIRAWHDPLDEPPLVRALAFAPDGRHVAIGTDAGAVLLWDVTTGDTRRLEGHFQPVTGLVFAPGGAVLASLSADKTTRLWSLPEGRALHVLAEPAGAPLAAGFLRDGAALAVVASDGSMAVWDVARGRPEHRRVTTDTAAGAGAGAGTGTGSGTGAAPAIAGLVIDGAAARIVIIGADGTITALPDSPDAPALWQAALPARGLAADPAGQRLLLRLPDRVAMLDPASGAMLWQSEPLPTRLSAAALSADGRIVALSDARGRLQLLDAGLGTVLADLAAHDSAAPVLQFTPPAGPDDVAAPAALVSGGDDGAIALWTPERLLPCLLGVRDGRALAFAPDAKRVAAGDGAGRITVTDTETCAEVLAHIPGTGEHWITALAFSPDGSQLAAAAGGRAHVLDPTTGGELWSAAVPGGHFVSDLAFSRDGARLVVGYRAQRPWANTGGWQSHAADGGQIISRSRDRDVAVGALAVMHAPSYVVTQERFGLHLWWPDSGQLRHRISGTDVSAWAFWPGQTRLAVGDSAGTITVLRHTGSRLQDFAAHDAPVTALAIAADGARLVSGAQDGEAAIWQAESGQLVTRLRGHAGAVRAADFVPGGDFVITAATDGTVVLWDSAAGAAISRHDMAPGPAPTITVSPDGRWFAAATGRDAARLWPLPRVESAPRDITAAIETATAWGFATGDALPQGRWQSLALQALYDSLPDAARPPLSITDLQQAETGRLAAMRGDALAAQTAWSALDAGDMSPAMAFAARANAAQLAGLVRVLDDHTDRVEALRLAPDGATLASVDWRGRLILWDTSDWRPRHVLDGDFTAEMAFAPDGRLLIGMEPAGLMVLDVASGAELSRLPAGRIGRWSADGDSIAVFDRLGPPVIHDARSGAERLRLTGLDPLSQAYDIAPDFGAIAVAQADGAGVLDPVTREIVARVASPDGAGLAPQDLLFADGAGVLAVIWQDGSASGHRLADGALLYALPGPIRAQQAAPDGRHILLEDAESRTRILDLATGAAGDSLSGQIPRDAAFLPDARHAVLNHGPSRAFGLFDRETGARSLRVANHAEAFVRLAADPAGQWWVSASGDGRLRLWDPAQIADAAQAAAASLTAPMPALLPPGILAQSPGGAEITAAGTEAQLRRPDAPSVTLAGHRADITAAALIDPGDDAPGRVVTAGADGQVIVHAATDGQPLQSFATGCAPATALAPVAGGTGLLLGCGDDRIMLHDLATGRALLRLPAPDGQVTAMHVTDGAAPHLILRTEITEEALPLSLSRSP